MLQQTRVDTVMPYYARVLERFPTVQALAEADEGAVLSAWSGLGYYRRARFLHAGARHVSRLSALPRGRDEWLTVPGVGPYTAGAIAGIAFGEAAPLVDGNVARVLARIFGLEDDVKSTRGMKAVWAVAERELRREDPGAWNQALMELGATVCTPKSPACEANLKKDIEIFSEANIPLYTEITSEQQKYAQISGAMMVEIDGKEMTLQQASVLLMSTARKKREDVYNKVSGRRLKDKGELDDLFTKLITLRHQVAVNADFKNFRDYMFKAMGRFDYTPKDCFNFHESIQSEVVPIQDGLAKDRKSKLNIDALRPWDKAVDPEGKDA